MRVLPVVESLEGSRLSSETMHADVSPAGLPVGLRRGHQTTLRELKPRPSARKGRTSASRQLVSGVIREVAGFAPYERRAMELLRNGKDKKVRGASWVAARSRSLSLAARRHRRCDEINWTTCADHVAALDACCLPARSRPRLLRSRDCLDGLVCIPRLTLTRRLASWSKPASARSAARSAKSTT